MAMKLLAHVLRGETLAVEEEAGGGAPIEPRRRVFRDLVARRFGYAPWGLAVPTPAGGSPPKRHEAASEPLWADTQPWYHR